MSEARIVDLDADMFGKFMEDRPSKRSAIICDDAVGYFEPVDYPSDELSG